MSCQEWQIEAKWTVKNAQEMVLAEKINQNLAIVSQSLSATSSHTVYLKYTTMLKQMLIQLDVGSRGLGIKLLC